MAKTICVLLDGARFDTVSTGAGYLEDAAEKKFAAKYRILGEIPSLSRPMYETCLTGLPVSTHGIVSNNTVRLSSCENLFSLCKKNGLSTAAAAYWWISELYNRAPFNSNTDRFQLENSEGSVTHGIYYSCDDYPDSHLFADGEYLRRRFSPDFLLYHSMGIDNAGHCSGSEGGGTSKKYQDAVYNTSDLLAQLVPLWVLDGWQIVITSDHGMNEFGTHGGTTSCEREVPLYVFSNRIQGGNFCETPVSQLYIAPLLCYLLEIPPSEGMLDAKGIYKCT